MHTFLLALLLGARPFTPEELLATHRPDDIQVSPDGKHVALTVRQKSLEQNRDQKDIWLLSLPGGEAKQFTRNGKSEHARWSPDGKSLLIGRESQLWLYPLEGGDPKQVTTLSTGADGGIFSPDGRWIAFTSEVYPGCADDACNRKRGEEREKAPKARVVDHLFARHWTEWKEGKRTHIFIQPAAGGPTRDVTPFDAAVPSVSLGSEDYVFTPAGELIVHSKPSDREAWSTNGDLFLIDQSAGAPKNLTVDNTGDDAQPRVSPDGKYLAWTSQARDG